MNDKLRRKKQVSKKVIAFWSIMAAIIVFLLVMLFIRVGQTREVSSYKNLDMITGEEMFIQKDDKYFVLIYSFEDNKDLESFDKGMYKYLTFCRDNGKHTKLYGLVSSKANNRKCFTTSSEQIDGAKQFPNALNEGQSDVLKIKEGSLPMLLVIENNEVKEHKTGENEILSYLKDVIKDAIAKK